MIKMNNELCRICGCILGEFETCSKCHLIITTICKCCNAIEHTQTHIHW